MKNFFSYLCLSLIAVTLYSCDKDSAIESSNNSKSNNNANKVSNQGSFSALTYNVAGLPEILSSSNPTANTGKMGQLIGQLYDIVNVQEDFNYHANLYETDTHPFRTATSGGVPIGSGLNTMSKYSFTDFDRVKWNDCNGTDCLTPKGFTFMRVRMAEGIYIDFYNAHPNASTGTADLAARRGNITQLANYINVNSVGNAVIVMFDTNCRYTRAEDNIRDLVNNCGLTDVWIKLIRNGNVPVAGSAALDCDASNIANTCEEVDKIFYRSSTQVALTAKDFSINNPLFVDDAGAPLSDHFPTSANFTWVQNSTFVASDLFGGPHGNLYNDITALSATSKVKKIILRGGSRVDKVAFELTNGTVLSHGGTGGSEKSLVLNSGEYIKTVTMCSGEKDGRTRIFYVEFITNQNRSVSVGAKTSSTYKYTTPDGYQIVGFNGRSGSEVDKLSVIGVAL